MKKILSVTSLLLALVMLFALVSCNTVEKTGAWENAPYRKNTELGKGEKTIAVEVVAEDQSITFTIHTDEATLGEALLEHDLIAGEEGPFGMYVKTVNGILADYDVDGYYWGLYKSGELMMVGVDGAAIADGEHYELKREK